MYANLWFSYDLLDSYRHVFVILSLTFTYGIDFVNMNHLMIIHMQLPY